MAFPIFDVKLAVVRVILLTVVLPLVSGICTGDGSKMDTCPDGEYCDSGDCYNCSFCSVDALQQGRSLTKCLCVENSAKICDAMQDSGNQLIKDPSQLSFTNLTGHENIDLSYLKESYNRSSIDCWVPTTTKESTTTPSSRPSTSSEVTRSKRSTLGGTTEEPTTSTKGLDFVHGIIIGIGAMVALILVALVIFFIIRQYKKKKKYDLVARDEGAGDEGAGDAEAGGAGAGGAGAGGTGAGGTGAGGTGAGGTGAGDEGAGDAEAGGAGAGGAGAGGTGAGGTGAGGAQAADAVTAGNAGTGELSAKDGEAGDAETPL